MPRVPLPEMRFHRNPFFPGTVTPYFTVRRVWTWAGALGGRCHFQAAILRRARLGNQPKGRTWSISTITGMCHREWRICPPGGPHLILRGSLASSMFGGNLLRRGASVWVWNWLLLVGCHISRRLRCRKAKRVRPSFDWGHSRKKKSPCNSMSTIAHSDISTPSVQETRPPH